MRWALKSRESQELAISVGFERRRDLVRYTPNSGPSRLELPLYAVLCQLFLITDVNRPNPECNELTHNGPFGSLRFYLFQLLQQRPRVLQVGRVLPENVFVRGRQMDHRGRVRGGAPLVHRTILLINARAWDVVPTYQPCLADRT